MDQHPPGQGIVGVRTDIAGLLRQVRDGVDEPRSAGIGRDVENVDPAVFQAACPEEAPVVGEAHVMSLAARPDRDLLNHLAVVLRLGIDIHRHHFVGAIAQTLHAQRPDINVVLLPLDQFGDVRRVAGFVAVGLRDFKRHGTCGDERRAEHCSMESDHDDSPLENTLISAPTVCAAQSSFAPESFTSFAYLSYSARISASNCSGVLVPMRTPNPAIFSLTSGDATAATTPALSFATMSRGTPAGASTPSIDAISKPGMPSSAMVGISGSAGVRLASALARMRTFPALAYCAIAV